MAIKSTRLKSFTVRIPETVLERLKWEGKQRGETPSELVRAAVWSIVQPEYNRKRWAALVYENARTRAFIARLAELQMDTSEVQKLLDLSKADANEYLKENLRYDVSSQAFEEY